MSHSKKALKIKNKERILRVAKEKGQVTHKGRPIRITPEFVTETMKVGRSRIDVLQALRDHGCQSRLLYPAKLSITIEGENKIFHDKTRFKKKFIHKSSPIKSSRSKIPTQGN